MRRLALCALLILAAASANAETLSGRVIACYDGDTCTVTDNAGTRHRIRLAGIDAPERRGAMWPTPPYSEGSRQNLVGLAKGKTATVEWGKRDRQGRIMGLMLVDGVDVGVVSRYSIDAFGTLPKQGRVHRARLFA